MRPQLSSLLRAVLDHLGFPASLKQALANHNLRADFSPQLTTISEKSVLRWNQFGEANAENWRHFSIGQVKGWSRHNGNYQSNIIEIPELAQIGTISKVDHYTVDISEIDGLASSESNLSAYVSLEEFARQECDIATSDINSKGLSENLEHEDVRIFRSDSCDFLCRYSWDRRLWLSNTGGSHQFAAAQWIAKRIGHKVPLTAKLITHGINSEAVTSLRSKFRGFLVSSKPSAFQAFANAMEAFKGSYYQLDLGAQHPNTRVVLLPKSDPRALRAAKILDDAAFTDALLTLHSVACKQGKCDSSELKQRAR